VTDTPSFNLSQHLIGDSRVMHELRAVIERLAPTRLAVLIHGPTGAGKELVAQALHALSGRRGRFLPVNIAAIPDAMFEDEFFGHVRGAFTGAIRDRAGLLAEAHGGTLFLDEIGSFNPMTQPKLLRVLETHQFRAVGSRVDQSSAFRTLAATNEDLDDLVATRGFRRDLRRRLAECVIYVPPLTDRREDIIPLARYFGQRAGGSRPIVITPDAHRTLLAYDWPDNVRELRQAVECALVLGDGEHIDANGLRLAVDQRRPKSAPVANISLSLDHRRLVHLLEECAWDTAVAAQRMGVHRSTIYRRMWRFGVTLPTGEPLRADGTDGARDR
jgi:DNA-binding NtrC family response regulator